MTGATISDETKELFGILGTLHDLITRCIDIHERETGEEIDDVAHNELCDAFAPALTFMESRITEKLQDFFDFTDKTAI